MLTACLTFAVVAALVTITPGLDTMLVLRATMTSGRRAGYMAALGIGGGCLAWAVAGALGLTALLAASELAFNIVRIAGACYLMWLGVQALWQARRRPAESQEDQPGLSPMAALRTGFMTNLLNPKAGVFYMSLLPQFVPDGASMLWTSLLFAMIHNLEGLLWFSLIVLTAGAARRALARPSVKRRFQQITGVAFIGFGVRLATDH